MHTTLEPRYQVLLLPTAVCLLFSILGADRIQPYGWLQQSYFLPARSLSHWQYVSYQDGRKAR